MKTKTSNFIYILALFLLIGCGGSSSIIQDKNSTNSNSTEINDSNISSSTSTPAVINYKYIQGDVIKGLVSKASIKVYNIENNQTIAETTTNEEGKYTITLDENFTGIVRVVSSGGSYIDEIDGKIKDASSMVLEAISFIDTNNTIINITPLTTLAHKDMLYKKASYSNLTLNDINYFNNLVAKVLTNKEFDATKTTPQLLDKDGINKLENFDNEEAYGLILAIISQISNSDASKVNLIINDIFNDIKDDEKIDNLYSLFITAINNNSIQNGASFEVIDNIKQMLIENITVNNFINFSKTLYPFDEFESNSSNAFYLKEEPIEINRSKKYRIYTEVTIAKSPTDTQPMQYFGFEELDENKTHINGSSGTYSYLIEAQRLEAGDYNFSFVIGDDINLSTQTKYIKPIILSNYQADENAVETKWSNIKIEEINYKDINGSLNIEIDQNNIKGQYGELILESNGTYEYKLNYKTILDSLKDDKFIDTFDITKNNQIIKKLNINIYNLGYNPKITLNGLKELYLQKGFNYREMGATALDIEDGNISSEVIVDTSSLDTTKVGEYKVYYNVEDSNSLKANPIYRVVHILTDEKDYTKTLDPNDKFPIYAQYMITTSSASLLSKYRRNLNLDLNFKMEHLASYAYSYVQGAIYWNNSEDNDFIWEKGIRKEDDDYKYAGKVNGEYQTIPTDEKCADPYSTDPDCNLEVAIVDTIGMDSSHYLGKWLVFFKALKDASLNEIEKSFYDEVLKSNSIRLEKNVSEFVDGVYKLTNYMDGTNGVYRWNYLNRGKNFGYNSYELSNIQVWSSLAFLDSKKVDDIYNHMLDNISSYDYLDINSSQELLVRLSLKYNDLSSTLSCEDINSYENCQEKYIFEHIIKSDLLKPFTGDEADSSASYYKVVGQHQLIMHYAFEHNIQEWKNIYYQHFKNFITEVIDTDAKHFQNLDGNENIVWKNSDPYTEVHYMLWASAFLELSSRYDKRDYSSYNFSIEDETKLRDFLEEYLYNYFQTNNQWNAFDIRYYKNY